jgi:hypothetical protein
MDVEGDEMEKVVSADETEKVITADEAVKAKSPWSSRVCILSRFCFILLRVLRIMTTLINHGFSSRALSILSRFYIIRFCSEF